MSALISPKQFEQMAASATPKPRLIDVRTPAEYRAVHITFAESMPIDTLSSRISELKSLAEAQPLYLVCKAGSRSQRAAEHLLAAGVRVAGQIEGGTDAWVAAGLPVVRGRAAWSIERQVRLIVGLAVVLFSGLAVAVHPAYAFGAMFFGAGLTFAGLTDWCGLGLLLGRCPWNR
jgi:rhodanese-related sulfurtransferase